MSLHYGEPQVAIGIAFLVIFLVQMTFGILIVVVGGEGRTHEILQGFHVGGAGAVWASLVALAAISGDPHAKKSERPLITARLAQAG